MLRLLRARPLRLVALLVPAGVAFYVLACGDASNTDAQNYFADTPITTSALADGGTTLILADGAIITPTADVYVPPVYDSGATTHPGTIQVTSTMTTGANVDLYSTLSIPMTLTSQMGFEGAASLLAINPPNGLGVAFQPDDPMVTPDVPGTCSLVITTKGGQAPGNVTINVLAYSGSSTVDAGTAVAFSVTINPRVTIEFPTAFENNPTQGMPQLSVGGAASLATNPLKVVFTNTDATEYVLVGADGAYAGFPDGQNPIPPGKTETAFSSGYTDAGTARVIDQKGAGTYHYYAKGYGTTADLANAGNGVDGGTGVLRGQIQINN